MLNGWMLFWLFSAKRTIAATVTTTNINASEEELDETLMNDNDQVSEETYGSDSDSSEEYEYPTAATANGGIDQSLVYSSESDDEETNS
ncbi:unnamed protein product [Didymodactylos carnosus]|uniref:Uncharacterized protein n=1 Tax=Didymodactylos carnosus TaxID=1234261 RepID=A0A816CQ64_9BILA|nr:unnamed protein product [Didymodactylos carnosus]CAF1623243.1 unnamed protein product [Didymodactylos carnosus]CAF4362244.1 unnamed protein product [Didymodactylos carnosus]CAF4515055.1 unnamed protein product [Didymodactylos carnosus]